MTKKVRIENADSGTNFKVVVQVWDKGPEGQPDVLAKEIPLDHPTAMTGAGVDDVYLTNSRYIVVKEVPPEPAPTAA